MLLLAAVCLVGLLIWLIASVPHYPVALIRVVDGSGKPIVGAIIQPDGLRTKQGPYGSGHYGWFTGDPDRPPSKPVATDADGYARIPYPKYVFERIETGQISFSVDHPDFAPDRPFREVDTRPPAGAPWKIWLDYIWGRLRIRALVARTAPVLLQQGTILKLSARPGASAPGNPPLYAQVSGSWSLSPDSWKRPMPGTAINRRVEPGLRRVRAIQFDPGGKTWFSTVISLTAIQAQTNELTVELKPGWTIRGTLDGQVPRPVAHGRVIAQVSPAGTTGADATPVWHDWAEIRPNGSFELGTFPYGDLEIVALCDGFVTTNGPGKFPSFRYPHKYESVTNNLRLTLGMEQTGCLQVTLLHDNAQPVSDGVVSTWPNIRYGEWSATVLGSDCYRTADRLLAEPKEKSWWTFNVPGLSGTTDAAGLVFLYNLPAEVKAISVTHPRFVVPAVGNTSMGKQREASVTITPGQTNHLTVTLEPKEQSPISHY